MQPDRVCCIQTTYLGAWSLVAPLWLYELASVWAPFMLLALRARAFRAGVSCVVAANVSREYARQIVFVWTMMRSKHGTRLTPGTSAGLHLLDPLHELGLSVLEHDELILLHGDAVLQRGDPVAQGGVLRREEIV